MKYPIYWQQSFNMGLRINTFPSLSSVLKVCAYLSEYVSSYKSIQGKLSNNTSLQRHNLRAYQPSAPESLSSNLLHLLLPGFMTSALWLPLHLVLIWFLWKCKVMIICRNVETTIFLLTGDSLSECWFFPALQIFKQNYFISEQAQLAIMYT
jgi:hypothetical protein